MKMINNIKEKVLREAIYNIEEIRDYYDDQALCRQFMNEDNTFECGAYVGLGKAIEALKKQIDSIWEGE